jgi:polar amino acid transport system substrate-binding protein
VDLVVATLGVSPERAKVIAFSNAYAPFYSGVYGNPKLQVKSAADLTEKSVIGVTRGTLEDAELGNLVPKNATIRRFDDNNATIGALIGGDVELIATCNVVAGAAAKKSPGKIEKKFVIRNSPAHIGVPRAEFELLAWVNAFIYQKKLNGELDALARKWFGEPLPDFPPF